MKNISLVELVMDNFDEDITVTINGKNYRLDITNNELGVMNCLIDTEKEFYGDSDLNKHINNLQEEIKERNAKRREERDRGYERYLEDYWYEEHCEMVCNY